MTRTPPTRRQLRLPLENESHPPAPEALHEEILKVLTDLLLEALGKEGADPTGAAEVDSDERKDRP